MAFSRQAQAPGRTDLRPVALPPLKSVRLLDPSRERIRLLHDSLRTEQASVARERPAPAGHEPMVANDAFAAP